MIQNFRKVLLINFRNLGDVLLMSPLVSALKQEMPSSLIDVAVYADCADMLSMGEKINNKILVQRTGQRWQKLLEDFRIAKKIRRTNYDLVISLTEGDRAAVYAYSSGAKIRIGIDHPSNSSSFWKRKAYTKLVPTQSDRKHRVEQNLDLLRSLGPQINYGSLPLRYELDEGSKKTVAHKLDIHTPYVVIHPGARWGFKALSLDQIVDLIRKIHAKGFHIVITHDQSAREQNFVEKLSLEVPSLFQDAEKLSICELAFLIRDAAVIFTSDSMPMHLAAAVGTKVVAWFGPSNERVWHPWQVEHVLIKRDYTCRPCGLDGCGRSKVSECLMALEPEMIMKEADHFLQH